MKNYIYIFSLVLLYSCQPTASDVPNGNFEKWKSKNNPKYWQLKGGERTAIAKEGRHAVRLQGIERKDAEDGVDPGVAFSGYFLNILKDKTFKPGLNGHPITFTPEKLTGYCMYRTEQTDTAVVAGWIEKEIDGENVKIATIGGFITDTTSVYKPFSFKFDYKEDYKEYDASKGRLWLAFTTSHDNPPLISSILYLDDVKIE